MTEAPRSLLRVLGLVFALAAVVGSVIGAGIMRAPGVVALGITSPVLTLLAWGLGGLLTLLTAMPLVEAGSAIPFAGGHYPIAARAFGPTAGFFTGWIAWLQNAGAGGFISAVFAEYVHRLGFLHGVPNGLLAAGLILTVAAINWTGTRITGASQSVASALKGLAFMVLVAILFATPRVYVATSPHHAVAAIAGSGALIMAVRVIYQTYSGWDAAIYFSEEVDRPDRNVARATFLGIGFVTLLYLMINAAVLHALPPSAFAGSPLAVGEAAKVALGPIADTVITALGLFSLAAIANLQPMIGARITYRMARDGVLPPFLGRVAPGGTPRWGVALMVAVALTLAATGSYESIVRIFAPWSIGAILMVTLSAIRLRFTEPDLPRPWRMPLFPWLPIGVAVMQAALVALMVWDDPAAGALSALVALAPVAVYRLFAARWRREAGLA
ncbi:MAG TPA: APC family permease [Caulobacteraceae bacterium]|nr:APC family permease [Caulobacteraceae bacterium]